MKIARVCRSSQSSESRLDRSRRCCRISRRDIATAERFDSNKWYKNEVEIPQVCRVVSRNRRNHAGVIVTAVLVVSEQSDPNKGLRLFNLTFESIQLYTTPACIQQLRACLIENIFCGIFLSKIPNVNRFYWSEIP